MTSTPRFDAFGSVRRHGGTVSGVILTVLLILTTLASSPAMAESSGSNGIAHVAGTSSLNMRSCPDIDCSIVATVPLSAEVWITGEIVDGFAPVQWEYHEGWAYSQFLSRSGNAELVRGGVPGCNRIALIFNAGIGEAPSWSILDTLISTQAPATLFAMGWWADAYPDYLLAMRQANVVIGSHGDTQMFLTGASNDRIAAEVRNSAARIAAVTGYPPVPYYTPYASDSDSRVRSIIAGEGYLPIGWSAAAADYNHDDKPDEVYQRVMNGASDGGIIELHLDGPATDASTAVVLPQIIRDLRAQGYTLVTVPEILLPCPAGI